MRFSASLILASAALSTALTLPHQQQDLGLGNWTVTQYTRGFAPVGSWRDLTVQYSGSTTNITCNWNNFHGQETNSCSDPAFSYTLGLSTSDSQEISPKQKVVIDGQEVTVTGTGALKLKCGGGVGTGCILDGVPQVVVVTATIDQ